LCLLVRSFGEALPEIDAPFRTKRIDGVGVADICKAAGLTHGALYGQFGSKQALVAEALAQHSFYLDRPQKHSAAPRTEGV
jgi:TetR/AcrR family transcriptional repressor of nem operon